MRIMNETSGADPRIVSKIAELEAGLTNGTITVQPSERTKLLRGTVRLLLSRMKDDATAYAPYVEITQIFLNTAVAVFALQLCLAVAVPLWESRRARSAEAASGSDRRLSNSG